MFEGHTRLRAVEHGDVRAYSLGTWLPYMEPDTDRAAQGNARGRNLIGEYPRSLLMQRIPGTLIQLPESAAACGRRG